jgi:hypothetical protein
MLVLKGLVEILAAFERIVQGVFGLRAGWCLCRGGDQSLLIDISMV